MDGGRGVLKLQRQVRPRKSNALDKGGRETRDWKKQTGARKEGMCSSGHESLSQPD